MSGLRRTKIVATLGPATDGSGMLDRLVAAGLDAARLNYSHGEANDHAKRAAAVREAAAKAGREIGIIADLHGYSGGTNGMKIVTVGDFVEHVG